MKRNSIFIATTVCLVAVGGACWWIAVKPTPTSPQPSAAIIPSEPETQPPVEQKIEDYIKWLHPRVQTTVSAGQLGYGARKEAVDALPRNLAPMDLQALMQFINNPAPADCSGSSWHALVDGIINVIRRQEAATAGFTQSLVRLYRDSPDPVLKDYAIQYLRHLYVDRDDTHKHETDLGARELILVTLIDAASQTSESYSGTALMALDDATTSSALKQEPETQAQLLAHTSDLNAALVKAASSPQTNKHCRISALQLCAMRELTEILPSARAFAADPKVDPNIRISAIAAIGQLGSLEQDQILLKQLENGGLRLAYAATPALKKLSNNQQ